MCYSVLQCVAVRCSVWQRGCVGDAVLGDAVYCSVLQFVVVWCSVLHCVAVCGSVLQRGGVGDAVLRDAVCCSVL